MLKDWKKDLAKLTVLRAPVGSLEKEPEKGQSEQNMESNPSSNFKTSHH